jgi:sulfite reductase (ferredoxin)
MTQETWKDRLADRMPEHWAREIDIFETQIELKRQGKLDDKIFAETRLRRGIYGQRYDNAQRHDGIDTRRLEFPCGPLTKGPDTVWDAPGMMRIKIPMGRLTAEQLERLAECAEEYSDCILHVTTRQDIQLHFVHIDDTPSMMRRLAAVGITSREACGNTVRNVTACPYAGVCADATFDVTPYARAMTYQLLGHRDTQDFGRKFKIAFSGCADHPCGLVSFHDLGLIAKQREVDGERVDGFALYVGGGLGSVPTEAKLFSEFVPATEILPLAQAVCRVFARLGEKDNRARARIKFLVKKLGLEEFRRLVLEERAIIPADERWTTYLDHLEDDPERPIHGPAPLPPGPRPPGYDAWARTNLWKQRQAGYATVTVRLPLGDVTSDQARSLANLAREHCGDTLRFTVEQNLVLRWVPEARLPELYRALSALGLGQEGAGTIGDITACPGTDTCKLGISSSRGLAAELERQIRPRLASLGDEVRGLRIKTSGCFNSCGQHHVADLGFLGVSRAVGGRRVAHFQLVVGGEWQRNGGAFGLAIGAFPSKRVPEVVQRLTDLWSAERQPGERFQAFIERIGRARIKGLLEELREVPPYEADPSFYVDWGDARAYTIGDMGTGECAGEVVSQVEFGLAAAEREVFEGQIYLEKNDPVQAARVAYQSMVTAAKALVRNELLDVGDAADAVVREFKTRFVDTKRFHDTYAGAKFAHYLLRAHEHPPRPGVDREAAHQLVEEAQLFIDAAHRCYEGMQQKAAAKPTLELGTSG